MATITATRAASGIPGRTNEKGVFCEVASYTLAANPVADVILLCNVAPGVTVVAVELYNAALGASTTISVGDSGSNTQFLGATATNATTRTRSAAAPKTYAAADQIRAVVGGATATGVITVIVYMTMDAVTLS